MRGTVCLTLDDAVQGQESAQDCKESILHTVLPLKQKFPKHNYYIIFINENLTTVAEKTGSPEVELAKLHLHHH